MKNTHKVALVIILAFALYFALQKALFGELRSWIDTYLQFIGLSHFITYLILGIPLFAGLVILHGLRKVPVALGMDKSIKLGLLFSLLCTTPMLVAYTVLFEFDSQITVSYILRGAVIAAFIEELFYRAILFGQFFKYTKLGFLLSIIFGAFLFASGHLYQSQDISTLIGIFITTFLGAIWFAWLYVEWNYNIWVPIFMHLFMNLFWILFAVSDNALGDTYANIFRIITIALATGLTIWYKIKKGISFEVNKNTILFKSNVP